MRFARARGRVRDTHAAADQVQRVGDRERGERVRAGVGALDLEDEYRQQRHRCHPQQTGRVVGRDEACERAAARQLFERGVCMPLQEHAEHKEVDADHEEGQRCHPREEDAGARCDRCEREQQDDLGDGIDRVLDEHRGALLQSGQHGVLQHEDRPDRGRGDERDAEPRVLPHVAELVGPPVHAEDEDRRGQHRQAEGRPVGDDDQVPGLRARRRHESIEHVREVEMRQVRQEPHRGDE